MSNPIRAGFWEADVLFGACHCPQPSESTAGYDRNHPSEAVLLNIGSNVRRYCLLKRRQSLGALLPNIVHVFPASLGRHTSGTPRLKGDRPDHLAAMFLALHPIGLRISEKTCQALHRKTLTKKQFRAMQLCDMCLWVLPSTATRIAAVGGS